MGAVTTLTSAVRCEDATTNVAFTIGQADGVYISTTITGGLTLTTPNGDVNFRLVPVGVTLWVTCTKAVFAGGNVVALKVN